MKSVGKERKGQPPTNFKYLKSVKALQTASKSAKNMLKWENSEPSHTSLEGKPTKPLCSWNSFVTQKFIFLQNKRNGDERKTNSNIERDNKQVIYIYIYSQKIYSKFYVGSLPFKVAESSITHKGLKGEW